ncbi:MAG: hypothetical protein PHF86_09325, partial [Candidatus Nanoarchaeia archaeon]|nr:hypothetical protein [Candidatus Nanoarchaeia archaeon]
KELPLTIAEFSIATPFPNTELNRIAKSYGYVDDKDISKFDEQSAVFVPFGLTKEYLVKMHRAARKEFYLRPNKIAEFVTDIRSPHDIIKYLKGFKVLVKSIVYI